MYVLLTKAMDLLCTHVFILFAQACIFFFSNFCVKIYTNLQTRLLSSSSGAWRSWEYHTSTQLILRSGNRVPQTTSQNAAQYEIEIIHLLKIFQWFRNIIQLILHVILYIHLWYWSYEGSKQRWNIPFPSIQKRYQYRYFEYQKAGSSLQCQNLCAMPWTNC